MIKMAAAHISVNQKGLEYGSCPKYESYPASPTRFFGWHKKYHHLLCHLIYSGSHLGAYSRAHEQFSFCVAQGASSYLYRGNSEYPHDCSNIPHLLWFKCYLV